MTTTKPTLETPWVRPMPVPPREILEAQSKVREAAGVHADAALHLELLLDAQRRYEQELEILERETKTSGRRIITIDEALGGRQGPVLYRKAIDPDRIDEARKAVTATARTMTQATNQLKKLLDDPYDPIDALARARDAGRRYVVTRDTTIAGKVYYRGDSIPMSDIPAASVESWIRSGIIIDAEVGR